MPKLNTKKVQDLIDERAYLTMDVPGDGYCGFHVIMLMAVIAL